MEKEVNLHNRFEQINEIGSGAYGTVFKGVNKETNEIVALKRVRIPLNDEGIPSNILREVSLLKHLSVYGHPNVIQILDVCHGKRFEKELIMYIVFEHMEEDLSLYLERHSSCGGLPTTQIRRMAQDILHGVNFLHSHRIVHRDLKPQNLLVNKNGCIKLADFGLAKTYDFHMKLTSVVVTLWYRAPEVLLGLSYATPVDIWSVGCIIAELYMLKSLFCGTSDNDQLLKIFRILGKPKPKEWPENVSILYSSLDIKEVINLRTLIPNLCETGYHLIMKMFTFDPTIRITASEALNHPYFTEEPLNT